MRRSACTAVVLSILSVPATPATAWSGVPDIILPAIGLGDVTRVPCGAWESQTPVPFTGSAEDLARMCPGDISVQLRRKRAKLVHRSRCYSLQGYASGGVLVWESHCSGPSHRTRRDDGWRY